MKLVVCEQNLIGLKASLWSGTYVPAQPQAAIMNAAKTLIKVTTT